MTRKKKRRKAARKSRQPSPTAGAEPAAATTSARLKEETGVKAGSEGGAYSKDLLARVRGLLSEGRSEKALSLVDSTWPSPESHPAVPSDDAGAAAGIAKVSDRILDRIGFLIRVWPDRAVQEVSELAPGRNSVPGLDELLADNILTWSDDQFERLKSAGRGDWLREAVLIRSASAAIARGDDREAMEILKGVGLRSAFRGSRLFLRGLSAYYRMNDDEAGKALGMIRNSKIFGPASGALLHLLDGNGSWNEGGNAGPGPG